MNAATNPAWLPNGFVEHAIDATLDQFLTLHRATPFLLVGIKNPTDELALGLSRTSPLEETTTGHRERMDGLAFATATHDARAISALRAEALGRPHRLHFDVATDAQLPPQLLSEPHFIVPLSKRHGAASLFVDRISVGRARNHDVVLRHPSVSKFHAWLEFNSEGAIFLRDAGSKNHTRLNGLKILDSKTQVKAGDEIKFGSVRARVCTAQAIWEALHRD